jgi:hypothetical protein
MPTEGEIKVNPKNPNQRAQWSGGQWRELDAGGLQVLGQGYKRNPSGKVYREGPRGGFEQVSGPNDTMIKEATTAATGVNSALAGIDRVDQQLAATKDIGPLGWITNPKSIAVLEQSVRDLQLRLKEQPYNLGVLNGPDLMLIEQIVANPSKLKNAAFRQAIAPRLANLADILGDQYRSEAERFGAQGGAETVLPPLYQSPRSRYSREDWGRQGRVKGKPAQTRGQPPAKQGGYKILSVE